MDRTCKAEGWTAAAVGAHVAMARDLLIDRVRRIVADEEFPPFDATGFHAGNARAAEEKSSSRERPHHLTAPHKCTYSTYVLIYGHVAHSPREER